MGGRRSIADFINGSNLRTCLTHPDIKSIFMGPMLVGRRGITKPHLYPKQHKMETQWTADSLLSALAGWEAT